METKTKTPPPWPCFMHPVGRDQGQCWCPRGISEAHQLALDAEDWAALTKAEGREVC